MRIGLLACDDVPEGLRHVAGGYRAMFEALLQPALPRLSFEPFDVVAGELPASPEVCQAWLCTGSRYSVYEERGWIADLAGFVREVQRTGAPYVGICFGHQLLAQALGGTVARAPAGWGVGVLEMHIVAPQPWMQPAATSARLQYMHADQVLELPPGASLLASAAHCPVAMFSLGKSMLGIQGHPEFPAAYVRALLAQRRRRIGEERAAAAMASAGARTDERLIAGWVRNFLLPEAG